MNRNRSFVAVAVALASLAAAPATRPAAERGGAAYESKTMGVTFRVPRQWERLTLRPAGREDVAFSFAPADMVTVTKQGDRVIELKRPEIPSKLTIVLGEPCARGTELPAVVGATRAQLVADVPAIAFTRDEATDVGGTPAWVLEWSDVHQLITTTVKNGKSSEQVKDVPIRIQKTVWLRNGTICNLFVLAPTKQFPAVERAAEGVRGTMTWAAARPAGR